jgi:hypothetical protein
MRTTLSALTFAAFMFSSFSHAAITVGPDKNCSRATLQDAVNDTKGANNQILVESTYDGEPAKQTVRINDKIISILGGFASCAAGATQTGISTFDAKGKVSNDPLIAITGRSFITITNFIIENGNNVGSNGGGISVITSGTFGGLSLTNVDIKGNKADRGAGLFYKGAATTDTLTMVSTTVESNSAVAAGGGVRIQGDVNMTMDAASSIKNNTANPEAATNQNDGHGGGLQMLDNTQAVINGEISGNKALAGGGMSLHDNAIAAMYATVHGVDALLVNNTAMNNAKTDGEGGGVYLFPTLVDQFGNDGIANPSFCANGVAVSGNTALDGAAVFGKTASSDIFDFNGSGTVFVGGSCGHGLAAPPCPTCANFIQNNTATQQNGAVIRREAHANDFFGFSSISGNKADHVFRISENSVFKCQNCLIANNAGNGTTTTDTVDIFNFIDGASTNTTNLVGCTIANNALAQAVFSDSDNLMVTDSVIWQPSHQTIPQPKNTTVFQNLLSQDGGSFSAAGFKTLTNVNSLSDPMFVNTAVGNYRLLEGSPAIDYSTTGTDGGIDFDGNPRGIILERAASPFDVGAFERQSCKANDDIFCDSFE